MSVEVDGVGQGLVQSSRSCSLGAAPNILRSTLQFLSSQGLSKYGLFGKFPSRPSSFYPSHKMELSPEWPQGSDGSSMNLAGTPVCLAWLAAIYMSVDGDIAIMPAWWGPLKLRLSSQCCL